MIVGVLVPSGYHELSVPEEIPDQVRSDRSWQVGLFLTAECFGEFATPIEAYTPGRSKAGSRSGRRPGV